MPTLSYTNWLIGWLILLTIPAWGQTEQSFTTYFDQGQRYEEQSIYRKALDAYRKALNYATATTRPAAQQAITRVDELIQQQTLVIESQTGEIRTVVATISSAANRDRIQSDLTALQQRRDAAVADYKALLRKANVLKQVETNIAVSEEEASRPERHPRPAMPGHRPAKPKSTLAPPPPKTITSRMPSIPKEGTRSKMESKATKSLKDDLH